jgi:hypothetical protein
MLKPEEVIVLEKDENNATVQHSREEISELFAEGYGIGTIKANGLIPNM